MEKINNDFIDKNAISDYFRTEIKKYASLSELSDKDYRKLSDNIKRINGGIKLLGEEYHPLALVVHSAFNSSSISLDDSRNLMLNEYISYLVDLQKKTLPTLDHSFKKELNDQIEATNTPYGFYELEMKNAPNLAHVVNILRIFTDFNSKDLEKKISSIYENNA